MPDGTHDGDRHSHLGDRKRVGLALALTVSFMVVEAVGGLMSGSLALLADAGHMLADSGALALALAGFHFAARPSDDRRSYGYGRAQVLAAFANGVMLLVVAVWIIAEAAERFVAGSQIAAIPMLIVAIAGLIANLAAFRILHGGDRHHSLNLRGVLLHVAGDILGSLAAIIAALVIIFGGWTLIDPLLSLLVAALLLFGAIDLIRRSGHILLEGAPETAEADDIRKRLLAALPEIEDVHHIHVWSLTEKHPLVTLHARVAGSADGDAALSRIKAFLDETYGIAHATVQLERGPCPDR